MELVEGQVAVVTGAASGIGLALADALAARGLAVVCADVEGPALEAAAEAVSRHGTSVATQLTDVSDGAAVDALAAAALERFGRVDVVCNNAGVSGRFGPMWEMDALDWEWILGVNLMGVVHGIRAFVPHLVAQGHGHVVNTASVAGIATIPWLGPYLASKHAVVALSEALRLELDDRAPAVGVTVVCPGIVRTRIGQAERNRPEHLRPEEPHPSGPRPSSSGAVALEPADVARQVLAAVEAGRLHVATHPGADALVAARLDAQVADFR